MTEPGVQVAALGQHPVTYVDIHMTQKETIGGVPVTEEQIQAWVAEAEAGYDVGRLRRRGRGRPGRGATPSQVIAVRLTAEELAALDARAAHAGLSRSEFVREAIARTAAGTNSSSMR